MAEITDREAIRFVNEQARPLAQEFRRLKAKIDWAIVDWFTKISPKIPNDSSPLMDDREEEGVGRVVGSDVVNGISQFLAFQSQMNADGVASVISKLCVTPQE